MPLDPGRSTYAGSRTLDATNLASEFQEFDEPLSPQVARALNDATDTSDASSEIGRTEGKATTDRLDQGDGVRILRPIPPSERSKLYNYELASRLDVLQSWEGAVIEIDHGTSQFTARLFDLTNTSADESEAVFDIADVSANDRDLLRPGGIFRWMIGYRRHSYGQQERVSAIVFRRLPTWYERDLEEAAIYGERLARAISIDEGVQHSPGQGRA